MKPKMIIAILVMTAVPMYAQAQTPSKVDAEKVVKTISGDKAKTQTFCDLLKLGGQIEEANQKKDTKKADDLSQKMDELEKQLGPEYVTLIDGLQGMDPNSPDGFEIGSMFTALAKLCRPA